MNATNLKIYHDPSEHREHLDDYDRQPPTQQPQPPDPPGQLDDNTNPSQEDQVNNNNEIPDTPQTAIGRGDAIPPTDDETSQHQDQPLPAVPQEPNKQWKLRNFLAGRFRMDEEKLEWNGMMAQKHGNPIIVLMAKCSTKLTVNSQKLEPDEKLVLNVNIE